MQNPSLTNAFLFILLNQNYFLWLLEVCLPSLTLLILFPPQFIMICRISKVPPPFQYGFHFPFFRPQRSSFIFLQSVKTLFPFAQIRSASFIKPFAFSNLLQISSSTHTVLSRSSNLTSTSQTNQGAINNDKTNYKFDYQRIKP